MRTLRLPGFLLLGLSTVACGDNILWLSDAQAARLADGHVATTVTATCDGDCSNDAAHCARVIWQTTSSTLDAGAGDGGSVTLDDSRTCVTTAPSNGTSESLVVTSQVAIPHDSAITALVELVNASGAPLQGGASSEGAAENTTETIADP